MTGKAASAATGPAHSKTLTGPLSSTVSPIRKCATTKITRYAIEHSAMMLVYLRESKRLRNERGITINLCKC